MIFNQQPPSSGGGGGLTHSVTIADSLNSCYDADSGTWTQSTTVATGNYFLFKKPVSSPDVDVYDANTGALIYNFSDANVVAVGVELSGIRPSKDYYAIVMPDADVLIDTYS